MRRVSDTVARETARAADTYVELVILCSSRVGLLGVGVRSIVLVVVLIEIKIKIELLLVLLFLLHSSKEVCRVVLLVCWCGSGSSILKCVNV